MSQELQATLNVTANTTGLERQLSASINRATNNGTVTLNANLNSASLEAFSRPLGKISAQANEFTKSMDAANARVLAFGASVAVFGAIARTFQEIVSSTLEVDKALVEISATLGSSAAEMQKFGKGIFEVAKSTGTSFALASSAVLEFARQGIGATQALERTKQAMILVRTTGISTAEAVGGLTAAFNAFESAGLTYESIVSKMATVDAKFAVGSKDIIEGISRSASVAQESKVSFDQLAGAITALKEKTGASGAILGNSFKSILTRLQSPEILSSIDKLGISISDSITGEGLGAIQILQNLGAELDNLSSAKRKDILRTVGGGFQIDKLAALLRDMKDTNSTFTKATNTSAGADVGAAALRNFKLDESIDAQLGRAANSAKELASNVGEIAFSSELKNSLKSITGGLETLNEFITGDGEKKGANLGGAMVKGISGALISGGGVLAGLLGAILLAKFAKFTKESIQDLLHLNVEKKKQLQIEDSILKELQSNEGLQRSILALEGNKTAQANLLLNKYKDSAFQMERMVKLSKELSSGLSAGGVEFDRGGNVKLRPNSYNADRSTSNANATSQAISDLARPARGPSRQEVSAAAATAASAITELTRNTSSFGGVAGGVSASDFGLRTPQRSNPFARTLNFGDLNPPSANGGFNNNFSRFSSEPASRSRVEATDKQRIQAIIDEFTVLPARSRLRESAEARKDRNLGERVDQYRPPYIGNLGAEVFTGFKSGNPSEVNPARGAFSRYDSPPSVNPTRDPALQRVTEAAEVAREAILDNSVAQTSASEAFRRSAGGALLMYTALSGVTAGIGALGDNAKAASTVIEKLGTAVILGSQVRGLTSTILDGRSFRETFRSAASAFSTARAETGGNAVQNTAAGIGAFARGGGLRAAGAGLAGAGAALAVGAEVYSAIDSAWKYFDGSVQRANKSTLAMAVSIQDYGKRMEEVRAIATKSLVEKNLYAGDGISGAYNRIGLNGIKRDGASDESSAKIIAALGQSKETSAPLLNGIFERLIKVIQSNDPELSASDTQDKAQKQFNEILINAAKNATESDTVPDLFTGKRVKTRGTRINPDALLNDLIGNFSSLGDQEKAIDKKDADKAQGKTFRVDLLKKQLDTIAQISKIQDSIVSSAENEALVQKDLNSTRESEKVALEFKAKALQQQREFQSDIKRLAEEGAQKYLSDQLGSQNELKDDRKNKIREAFQNLSSSSSQDLQKNFQAALKAAEGTGEQIERIVRLTNEELRVKHAANDAVVYKNALEAKNVAYIKQQNYEYNLRKDILTGEFQQRQKSFELEKKIADLKNQTSDTKYARESLQNDLSPLQQRFADAKRAAEVNVARDRQAQQIERRQLESGNQEKVANFILGKGGSPEQARAISSSKDPTQAIADFLNDPANNFSSLVTSAGKEFLEAVRKANEIVNPSGSDSLLSGASFDITKLSGDTIDRRVDELSRNGGTNPEDIAEVEAFRNEQNRRAAERPKALFISREATGGLVPLDQAPTKALNERNNEAQKKFDAEVALAGDFSTKRGILEARRSIDDSIIGFHKQLGENIPLAFRDSMVSAMKDIASGAKGVKEGLLGAATAFLTKINDALYTNLANKLTAPFVGASGNVAGSEGTGIAGSILSFIGKANGGPIDVGSGVRDDVPAMLMRGEYVIKKDAVSKYGSDFLSKLNEGQIQKFSQGGQVGFSELNTSNYIAPNSYQQYGQRRSGNLSFDKSGNVIGMDGYSGIPENAQDAQKRAQANFYGASAQNGVGGFYAPSFGGAGAIQGQRNLLSFATQQTASGRSDRLGAGGINIAGGSSNLSLFALTDGENLRNAETSKAKDAALGLYFGGIDAQKEKATRDYEEKKRYADAVDALKKAQKEAIKGALISAFAAAAASGVSSGLSKGYKAGVSNATDAAAASGETLSNSSKYWAGLKGSITNFGAKSAVKKAAGGAISGGNGLHDDIPTMLTGGEFVMSKQAASNIGYGKLQKMNSTGKSEGGSSDVSALTAKFDELIEKLNAVGTVNITVNSSGGKEQSKEEGANHQQTQELGRKIKQVVMDVLKDEKRLGGMIR